ncbi:MAG: NACHT domain-containing protein [Chloroflexi bacterium]|nr:NACHT domain-containing protein [Chloroflexota bacterium]
MKLNRTQWLILLSALLTVAIGVATNIATGEMPTWAQPYLWLAWPLLGLLTIMFLFVTWRQASAEPRPPDRKLVWAYLQEVAAEPLFTLADEVLGKAEFIPREVTAQETRGLFSRFAAVYRPGGAPAEAGGPVRPEPLEAVLIRERRLVLLGEPGMGKTTSLRHLAQVTAQQALASRDDIPIYVELKYYAGEPELEMLLVRHVDDVLKRRKLILGYDEAGRTQAMRAWLAAKNARFLLILDGLNEVAPDQRMNALNALEGLLGYPHRLLVSCREQDYDESLREHAFAFVLQGLQEDEIRGYLRARLGDRGETLFDNQIRWDEKMRTLVANPLMLWLVGEVARANPEARLPANRGQLFRVFAEAMPGLRRKEGVPMPDVPQDVVEAVLRVLAFAMQEHGPPPPDLGRVRGWGLPTATYRLEDVLTVGKAWRFLKSDGLAGEPVEFLHPLFQEYFAADELRARLEHQRNYAAILGDRPFTDEWDEVVMMLAGIHDDPVGLVKWLAVEATARQAWGAALLVHRCWETSKAVDDAEARAAVVEAVIDTLRRGTHERWLAVKILGEIKDPRAVEPLIWALDDIQQDVREEAVWALGEIRDPRVVEPLIHAARGGYMVDAEARSTAKKALGEIGAPAVKPLILALGDPAKEVRQVAAEALGEIGAPAVEPLIQALRDPDERVRSGAVEALGRIGEPAVKPLILALRYLGEGVRLWAVEAIGKIGKPAVEPLIQVLHEPEPWVRSGATEALGRIGEPAVEPLIQALRDPDERVRSWAVEAIGKIGKPAVEPLIQVLHDPNPWVRSGAAEALGRIGGHRAVVSLIQALRDPDEGVRYEAAVAMGEIGDAWAVRYLIPALRNPDARVRWRAAKALGKIGDPRALPWLEWVARGDRGKTPWGDVADAAMKAMERIRERRGQ